MNWQLIATSLNIPSFLSQSEGEGQGASHHTSPASPRACPEAGVPGDLFTHLRITTTFNSLQVKMHGYLCVSNRFTD